MPSIWYRTLVQHSLILAAGALVGWLYDGILWGVLFAALGLLAWHLYHLFTLERWLATGEHGPLPDGNGLWAQLFARIEAVNQRRREYRRSWTRLAKEFRRSTKAFPDGGVILTPNLEVVRSNKAARDLLGLKKKRDRGTRIDNLIRHPDFVRYLEQGTSKESAEIPAPGNSGRWLSCRVMPYGVDQKLLLVRDISDSVNIARARRDFVANASHELRTPLTVMTGYLDMMAAAPEFPQAWRGPVAEMGEQAARMERLVQDLLLLSKLESGPPGSRDKAVDIVSILADSVRDVRALTERPQHIELDIGSDARILGEKSDLQSIVENLLSNAVRYTPADGSITVSWQTDDTGGHLCVADTGIGIPADEVPRLTERFYRTDAGRARQQGGTGLGLAIVKHALIHHDGELEIISKPGEGSRFCCHFPPDRLAPAVSAAGLAQ